MLRLFIENREIELNKDVQFAITSQFENLSNPTDIINDWSKTVSIPFTHNNNVTFGHIYCPDKSIVDGGTVGVYFNPLKKLNFRLIWNDNIVMMGYAKLNQVKQNSGKGTYEVTLFGELGKVFQEMKKITFDTSTVDNSYLIDGSEYVDEYINKELVYKSWTSTGQSTDRLQPKYIHIVNPTTGEIGTIPNVSYKVTDIIGFAPNNSFSDGFDYKSFQKQGNISEKFTNILGSGFTQDTHVEPDTAIPNGLLPREIGEYRSYLQLPFIYWNKLFKIFQTKAQSITGYQFDLDSSWFNTNNPYWYNLVYMLKPFDSKLGNIYNNEYTGFSTRFYDTNGVNLGEWNTSANYTTERNYRLNPNTITFEQMAGALERDNYHNQFVFSNNEIMNFHFKINTYLFVITQGIHIKDTNALLFSVKATGSNGTVKEQLFAIRHSGSVMSYDNAINIDTGDSGANGFYQYAIDIPTMNAYFTLTKAEMGDTITFSTTCKWLYNEYPLNGSATGSVVLYYGGSSMSGQQVGTPSILELTLPDKYWFHSNAKFILNDLWNNDYNLFSEVIKYCKMYRIFISVDEINKKINFKKCSTLFSDYSIKNWTNYVDKSKDFDIKPVTFENKYVLFNYKDVDSKLAKEYKEKYGVNYGEYRLVTDYNFNSETTKLFDEVTPSIVNTDNVLSWNNLYNHKIAYSFPSEIYVYNKDKDKKQVDVFGAYYFHNGTTSFSTESSLNLRSIVISDDTSFQQGNNTYFYTQDSDITKSVTTYPKLDIVKSDKMCVFNIPKENYTYLDNYSGKTTIYSNFWADYLNERYNVQNKKITCYVNLKPTEYCQFDWNNLKLIDNQLCMVNKIYDYDITNLGSTKVDLITIQDLNGYT